MTDQPAPELSPADRRRAALQRNATQRAERTVARLQEGIASLTRARLPITGPLIKRETGLDYKTIQRNPAAYALFCKHAAHFIQSRTAKRSTRGNSKGRHKKRRASMGAQPTPRNPLLERPKRRLIEQIRVLESENAELVQAAVRLALAQQDIEAQKMELRGRLVATERNLQVLIAEHTAGNA